MKWFVIHTQRKKYQNPEEHDGNVNNVREEIDDDPLDINHSDYM